MKNEEIRNLSQKIKKYMLKKKMNLKEIRNILPYKLNSVIIMEVINIIKKFDISINTKRYNKKKN